MNSIPNSALLITLIAAVIAITLFFALSKGNKKFDGELQIDESNPNKDLYRFVLYYDPEELIKKDKVTFKVVRSDGIIESGSTLDHV